LKCRVGINASPMIVGDMGSDQVFDYAAIGDSFNLASRLESVNKRYKTYVMIPQSTHNSLRPEIFRTRVLDVIKAKGKWRALKVFEVLEESSVNLSPQEGLFYRAYGEAFAAYLSIDLRPAQAKFKKALSLRPDDLASKDMVARIESLDPDNLPSDWGGPISLTSKWRRSLLGETPRSALFFIFPINRRPSNDP
jgi:adenylate cyclase